MWGHGGHQRFLEKLLQTLGSLCTWLQGVQGSHSPSITPWLRTPDLQCYLRKPKTQLSFISAYILRFPLVSSGSTVIPWNLQGMGSRTPADKQSLWMLKMAQYSRASVFVGSSSVDTEGRLYFTCSVWFLHSFPSFFKRLFVYSYKLFISCIMESRDTCITTPIHST